MITFLKWLAIIIFAPFVIAFIAWIILGMYNLIKIYVDAYRKRK